MKWIGLTGGIATGKSTVARILGEQKIPVIDADLLAREVVSVGTDGYKDIVQAFGPGAVMPDGNLNRKVIGQMVFGRPEKLAMLEGIIHPRVRAIQRHQRELFELNGHLIAFYDVPLLFEKNLQDDFDVTVAVLCNEATQLQRLMDRDGLSREDAEKRIRAQLPLIEKARRADYVIRNDGTFEDLRRDAIALLTRLA